MKKKLALATALLALGVISNVKAESDYGSYSPSGRGYYGYDDYTSQPRLTGQQEKIGFRTDWADARDFGVKPIDEKATEIKVKTAPGALVMVTLTLKEAPKFTIPLYELDNQGTSVKPNYRIKPTVAGPNGLATFYLSNSGTYKKNYDKDDEITKNTRTEAIKGDIYSVTASIDGWTLGSDKWTVGNSMPQDKMEEKEKADREKKEQEAKTKEEEEQKEQETQAEVTSSGLTNQTNINDVESQTQNDAELNGVEEHSTTTQNDESRQEKADDSSQKEESSWTVRFTSSVRNAWNKVKTWFKSWWQG
ncbi:UNVERIFIED_CONTAM: hypothetical protein KB582_00205 [Streptococcus canis]